MVVNKTIDIPFVEHITEEERFNLEFLWNKYPKKVGKKEALYYYNQAIKNGESFDVIEQGLDNYIDYLKNEGTPDIHIKYGSNWFKNECWNDEYETNNHYFDDIF